MIDATKLTTEALQDYDAMIYRAYTSIERTSGLATAVWQDVLKELDARGLVRLVSGSYDDVGNALIQRLYEEKN